MKKLVLTTIITVTSLTSISFAQNLNLQDSIVQSNEFLKKEIIVNFKQVNSGIYRGARLETVAAIDYLRSLGIKTIINLQGGDLNSKFGKIIPWAEPGEKPEVIEWEKQNALALGISYFHTPLNSLEEITKDEDKAIDETLEFMHNKDNQPLFIHCEHGADRTGLLVALYRVKYEKMGVERARSEWIANGHNELHQILELRSPP
jgi:protein tyrosine/serine phosphatase